MMINIASVSFSMAGVLLLDALLLSIITVVPDLEAKRTIAVVTMLALAGIFIGLGVISRRHWRTFRWYADHWIVRWYAGLVLVLAWLATFVLVG